VTGPGAYGAKSPLALYALGPSSAKPCYASSATRMRRVRAARAANWSAEG
jgi:hypothetical protein